MGRGLGWPPHELLILCKAWITVSENVEEYQEMGFWNGVDNVFHSLSDKKRSKTAIMKLWAQITREVAKFCDVYYTVCARYAEEDKKNEEELIEEALEEFYRKKKIRFKYIDCWKILANCRFWRGPTNWHKKPIEVNSDSLEKEIESHKRLRVGSSKMHSYIPTDSTMKFQKERLEEEQRGKELLEENNNILVLCRPQYKDSEVAKNFFQMLEEKYVMRAEEIARAKKNRGVVKISI